MTYILVVDDEPAIGTMVQAILTDEGYQVVVATSGPAALQLCARAVPKLLLCDQMMPEMTGMELCARLAHDPRYASMPIVMMSAGVDAHHPGMGRCDAFLKKPFHLTTLVMLITSLIPSISANGAG